MSGWLGNARHGKRKREMEREGCRLLGNVMYTEINEPREKRDKALTINSLKKKALHHQCATMRKRGPLVSTPWVGTHLLVSWKSSADG